MLKNSNRYFLFILATVSLAVRGAYFYQFRGNPFFEYVPKAWDQTVYHEGGLAFAHGDLLAVAPNQVNLFSPLYQYFVGLIYRFLLDQVQMVWITQFFMGTLSTILVYKIAKHYFEPIVGFIAGLLFTLYGGNLFYEGILYREAFITFLGLLSFYLLIRFSKKPAVPAMALSALSLALLMQSRANNILLVPVALVYLWAGSLRAHGKGRQLFAGYVAILLVMAIPLLVWGYAVRGFWALYDQSGPDIFLAGNNLDYPGRGYMRTDAYKTYQEGAPLATLPVIRFILKTAWEHPWEFFQLYLRKIYYYFNNYEVPNSLNYYIFEEFAPVLKWGVPFALIGALGLTGSVLAWRLKNGARLLHAWFLVDVGMVLPFCILSRFRLPVVPVLSIFAGYVLWYALRKAYEQRWITVSAIAACVIILGWAERTEPLPEGRIGIRDHINFGTAYLMNDHPEDDLRGYEFYKRAWELSRSLKFEYREPETVGHALANYHLNIGKKALVGEGTQQGVEDLKKSLYYEYAQADAHFIYAAILSEANSPRQALLEALQAVVFSPSSPEAHLILGSIYQDMFNLGAPAAFHLKTAMDNVSSKRQEDTIAGQVRARLDQLKSQNVSDTESPEQMRELLRSKLPPLLDIPFDLTIPDTFAKKSSEEIEQYLILLFQYLALPGGNEEGKVYCQLGVLYLKKVGVKEAAYVYFKKAWEKGIQNQMIADQLNDLKIELSGRPFI